MHDANDTPELSLELSGEAATMALGGALAGALRPGMTVYLHGDLGAGKTTLVRGILKALGYAGRVKSPTYTLLESYELSSFTLQHYDLYRMIDPREWLDAGFRDDCNEATLCLVEWPEKAAGLLPLPDVRIRLLMSGEGRKALLHADSIAGRRCVEALKWFSGDQSDRSSC